MGHGKRGLTGWCAATVLVSAFLLFQVQPMVSKMILPWFGGTPAVWTTCMLFFQLFLLLGYLYAHLLDRLHHTRWQGIIHTALLLAAAIALPIVPDTAWKPMDSSHPQWRILCLLAANVGLPYLLLAASAPLVQAWYSRASGGRLPYRLYALSNVGSLAALLSYPFWIEPGFDIPAQGALWSSGFCAYAVLCGSLALVMARWNVPALGGADHVQQPRSAPTDLHPVARLLLWVLLPAFGSMALLAVTNQICQDVAVIPFLWVAPLSIYLITFILCFDSEFWYRRTLFAVTAMVFLAAIACVLFRDNVQPLIDRWIWLIEPLGVKEFDVPDFLDSITLEVSLYLGALFAVCMLCHGELVRSKPQPRLLTLFYLCISAGGALGGLFVALICPMFFSTYVESTAFLLGGALLGLFVVFDGWWDREQRWADWWRALLGWPASLLRALMHVPRRRDGQSRPDERLGFVPRARIMWSSRPWYSYWNLLFPVPFLVGLVALFFVAEVPSNDDIVSRRSFYGVLSVSEYDMGTDDQRRNLYNGRILHGIQLTAPGWELEPTTYYSYDSGIGLTITNLATHPEPLRVATVGLGTGTIASYGDQGDYYCFYEINPDVIDIAREYFTFLSESPADVHVVEGDARLSMERQDPQDYDVIALDAFSSDAIPAHLLTVEAVKVYLRHLKHDGVLAVHTSNRHLDLVPIVAKLAAHYDLQVVAVDAEDYGGVADSSSEWLLVTRNEAFLSMLEIEDVSYPVAPARPEIRVWTDQYSNLFQIVRAWNEDDEVDEEAEGAE